MIDPNEFDVTLRERLDAEKFAPFFVEMDDGQRILIRVPLLAFGGGSAAFIDAEDGALVDFTHAHVRGFLTASQEIGA